MYDSRAMREFEAEVNVAPLYWSLQYRSIPGPQPVESLKFSHAFFVNITLRPRS